MGNHFHFLFGNVGGEPGVGHELDARGLLARLEPPPAAPRHVFQGHHKAVVVNGVERDGSYFKIVADYIHLNPVRSGCRSNGLVYIRNRLMGQPLVAHIALNRGERSELAEAGAQLM